MLRFKGLATPTLINSFNSLLSLFYSVHFARQIESKLVLGQLLSLFLVTSILMSLTSPVAKLLLLSDDNREKNRLIFILSILLSCIGGIAGYIILKKSGNTLDEYSAIWLVIFIINRLVFGGINDYILGNKYAKYIGIYTFSYLVLLYINISSGIYIGKEMIKLIIIFELGRVILASIFMPVWRSSRRCSTLMKVSIIKEYFGLVAYSLIANLKQHLDKTVVLIFLSTELYAEYQLGVISNPLVIILSLSFTTYSLPLLAKSFKEGKGVFYKAHVSLISKISKLSIPIIVFTIIWSTEIIRMFYGHDFTETEKIFGIFSCSYITSHINVANLFLVIGEKSKLSILAIINIIISAILLVILVPIFGVYGAVYSVVLSVLLGYVYPLIVLCKKGISVVSLLNWFEQLGLFALSILLASSMRLLLKFNLIGDYSVIIWSVLYFILFQLMLSFNQNKSVFRLG